MNIIQNKKLSEEINKRAKKDQSLRSKAINNPENKSLAKKVFDYDQSNITFIEEILEKYGWPTFNLIGKRANKDFWILVQHIYNNIDLQEKALQLYKEALNNNQAHKDFYPYLYDRVYLAKGKKQKFGTQFNISNGQLVPKPLQNKKKVDEYRKEYGLESMDEKIKEMKKTYEQMLKKSKSEKSK